MFGTMLALSIAACGPKTDKTIDASINQTEETAESVGNTTLNTANFALDKVAKNDAFEIAAAKLALEHTSSAKVKTFAREIISLHAASTAKIKAAAPRGAPAITPASTLTSAQNDKLADLGKFNGPNSDRAYLSSQIDAHEDVLSLMRMAMSRR